MTDSANRPDPERRRLLRSVYELSSLANVAEAIAIATEHEKRVYVERIDSAYRWSLTDPGGLYPLLRITARFLRIDYHGLVIGFRAVADGVYVLAKEPDTDRNPEAWAVLNFDGPAEPADVAELIVRALEPQ